MYFEYKYVNNKLGIHNIFTSRRAHKLCPTNFYKILRVLRCLIIADVLIRIRSSHTYPRIRIKFSSWIYDLI